MLWKAELAAISGSGCVSFDESSDFLNLLIFYPYQSTLHSSSCASVNPQLCFASIAPNIASVTSVLAVSPNFLHSSEYSFSKCRPYCVALNKISFFVSWHIMHLLKESVRGDLFKLSRLSNIYNCVTHENNLFMQLSIMKVIWISRMVFGMKCRSLTFASYIYMGLFVLCLALQKGFLKISSPSMKNHNAGVVTCLKVYCWKQLKRLTMHNKKTQNQAW